MKIKNSFAFCLVAFSCIVFAFSVFAGNEKIDLRLRLEKGQSYKMQTITDMKINQTIPGQQQVMTILQRSGGKNIYTIEDVQADGTIVLKITHDAISSKIESANAMQNMEYDSTDTSTATGPLAPILGAIIGQSFTIVITPAGHIKEIQGASELLGNIQEKINELPEGPLRAGVETNLKMQYGEEALKANTENSFDMYPDHPVGIGDTWQRRTVLNQGFPMVVDAIYTLKERKNGVAVIDIFAMIRTNRDTGSMEMGNMNLSYNVSGTAMRLIEIEESTGWMIRSDQNLRLNGSITVQSPQMQQPMSMPISISGTITQEPY